MKSRLGSLLRRMKLFDRRKDTRFEIVQNAQNIECICTYIKSGQQLERNCWISNISKGGLLLMTENEKIYPHTQVTIVLKFSATEEKISLIGSVVRTYRRKMENWYYSGIKFTNKEEAVINKLLDVLVKKPDEAKVDVKQEVFPTERSRECTEKE